MILISLLSCYSVPSISSVSIHSSPSALVLHGSIVLVCFVTLFSTFFCILRLYEPVLSRYYFTVPTSRHLRHGKFDLCLCSLISSCQCPLILAESRMYAANDLGELIVPYCNVVPDFLQSCEQVSSASFCVIELWKSWRWLTLVWVWRRVVTMFSCDNFDSWKHWPVLIDVTRKLWLMFLGTFCDRVVVRDLRVLDRGTFCFWWREHVWAWLNGFGEGRGFAWAWVLCSIGRGEK